MLINNMQPFLDFTQSNLNFEASFVGICHVFRKIWPFEHEFQAKILGNSEFWGV